MAFLVSEFQLVLYAISTFKKSYLRLAKGTYSADKISVGLQMEELNGNALW